MTDTPVTITDQTFAEAVLDAEVPVLVDFTAPWCAPCRAIAPTMKELASMYAGRVIIAKVDVDENPRLAAEFAIMGLPTVILFKEGKMVERIQGARPKAVYTGQLDALVANATLTAV